MNGELDDAVADDDGQESRTHATAKTCATSMWNAQSSAGTRDLREKLHSPQEAAADLSELHEKLELFPDCRLGMWTNGHEESFSPGR